MNCNKDTDINESEFDDIRQYQEITDSKTIYELLGDVVILNRYKNNFKYLLDRVVDVATLCWSNKDENGEKLEHTMIKFKIDIDDKITHELMLNRFMISLVFIKTIIQYIESIDINDFILTGFMTDKMRGRIQKNIIKTLMDNGHPVKEIQEVMSDMSLELKEIITIFSHANMRIYTAENLFLNHYRDSEIIREINNTEYPPDMQTSEIVEENKRRNEILTEEMTKRQNPFYMDNRFVNIIKPKQMEELYINFSQVPDGEDIVPVIMNGNGFKAGYHSIDVLYAGSIAARVPDIMNESYMGKAGYFNRNLMILTYGTISKTVYDCGSENPIPITVDDVVLNMMDGRFYYTHKGSKILHVLKKTDTHLIGKELWFRSPCTCNLNEDCCHVCYGTKALKVSNLKGGFIYTTEIMTSRVSQNILSAKHLLKTNAEKIEFSEGFNDYFIIESSTVFPNEEKRFDIHIREDYHENISESLTLYVGKDLKPLTISNYASIDIPEEIFDKSKEVVIDDVVYHKINSNKVLETDGLCTIIPINIMMTQKYMHIMKLFETGISKFDKVEDAVVTLMNLLYKTIPLLSTHGEIIIGQLLRNPENKLLRPDFLTPDVPYQILNLKDALKNIESVTTALSFENTKIHLLSSIFDERNKINRVGPRSFADYIYGEEVL